MVQISSTTTHELSSVLITGFLRLLECLKHALPLVAGESRRREAAGARQDSTGPGGWNGRRARLLVGTLAHRHGEWSPRPRDAQEIGDLADEDSGDEPESTDA